MPLYPPPPSAGAPDSADYLVGTSNGSLSGEIVVGATPGGELGGTWGSPTVDATHSGSAHHASTNDPSSGEKAALAGSSGTPGSGNKYVTDADSRNTNARTPSAHATSHKSGGSDPIKLNEFAAPTADVDLNSHKLTNVTDPGSAQDASTKAYVDATVAGAGGLSDHGVITYLDATVAAAPADPSAGRIRIYAKTGGHMAQRDSAGVETLLDQSGGGGSVATDAIFDAKGDLAVGTGADTAAKLTVGANGTRPEAASGQSTGIQWSYPPGYEVDYVEFTSNVNITATTSAGSDVIVTASSVTYDGTAVRVRTQAGYWECPAANSLVIVLWDNTAGAALGTIAQFTNPDATNVMRVGGMFERRFTPAAGARILSIRGFVGSAATGVIGVGAGGAGVKMPGFIRITKV